MARSYEAADTLSTCGTPGRSPRPHDSPIHRPLRLSPLRQRSPPVTKCAQLGRPRQVTASIVVRPAHVALSATRRHIDLLCGRPIDTVRCGTDTDPTPDR